MSPQSSEARFIGSFRKVRTGERAEAIGEMTIEHDEKWSRKLLQNLVRHFRRQMKSRQEHRIKKTALMALQQNLKGEKGQNKFSNCKRRAEALFLIDKGCVLLSNVYYKLEMRETLEALVINSAKNPRGRNHKRSNHAVATHSKLV